MDIVPERSRGARRALDWSLGDYASAWPRRPAHADTERANGDPEQVHTEREKRSYSAVGSR